MKAKIQDKSRPLDILVWALVVLGVAAIVVGNLYFTHISPAIRAFAIIATTIVLLGLAYTTQKGHSIWKFFVASRMEMRKVTWPTRQETLQTTLLIIVIVCITGLFLWGIDYFFAYIVGKLVA